MKQIGEAAGFVAGGVFIRVYFLAQECDLFYAVVGESFNLFDYRSRGAGDLRAADVGDDAVRTEVVAAAHYADEGLAGEVFISAVEDRFKLIEGEIFSVIGLLADFVFYTQELGFFIESGTDELRDLRNLGGTADYVDGVIFEQFCA